VKSVIKQSGFSLTEVLMAVAILSVGMMLIATMFPVGIYLTGAAAERTMAAIVADEAFAKIQLYGIVDTHNDPANSYDYENELGPTRIDPCEFSYPPIDPCSTNRQYYWSALYRKLGTAEPNYQITIFVARKTNPNLKYWNNFYNPSDSPRVFDVNADTAAASDKLSVWSVEKKYINPQATILDNATGQLYRVMDRADSADANAVVTLDKNWEGALPGRVWLVPPPETGGRNADIAVFQRIMRF
jgi:prepilin-type N-terminal cleavage/methylation domain-containing protein